MKTTRLALLIVFISIYSGAFTQNLVVNPGAELLPAGTGWNVASSGGACAAGTAANTFTNWTMTPDNSANYPAAHGGARTFFAGCNAVAGPTYELFQSINVSGSAAQIDAGSVAYIFSGYIQTPIATQGDAGRFIVDFLNASNVVLGTSYTVSQSGSGGSGNTWRLYSNTRNAPAGTRTIRIRLQATIATTPAINAYFDDISLVQTGALPIRLVNFDVINSSQQVTLNWTTADASNFKDFTVERSSDGYSYTQIAEVSWLANREAYSFADLSAPSAGKFYYRLKLNDADGRFNYSPVLLVNRNGGLKFTLSPNPASGNVVISGLNARGNIHINNSAGSVLKKIPVTSSSVSVDISTLPRGLYIVQYIDESDVQTQKLYVR